MLQASRTHEKSVFSWRVALNMMQIEGVTTNLAATHFNYTTRVCLLIIKHTLYQTHGVYGSANNVIMGIDPGHDPSTRGTGPENPAGSGPGLILSQGRASNHLDSRALRFPPPLTYSWWCMYISLTASEPHASRFASCIILHWLYFLSSSYALRLSRIHPFFDSNAVCTATNSIYQLTIHSYDIGFPLCTMKPYDVNHTCGCSQAGSLSSKSELPSSHDYAVIMQQALLFVYSEDAGMDRWCPNLGYIYACINRNGANEPQPRAPPLCPFSICACYNPRSPLHGS
ncbi:Uncharacterized protein LW94_3174 [Fusarium fujikuroi]|nr:Uncharacterized protein Y057_120 [Fusarium fujikuroi]KLP20676.1 Uncharacterized protein LW94_3174 [Fusarium fujikuroi]